MYWALRWPLRHPAYAVDSIDGYGGTNTVAADADDFNIINLIIDGWPFTLPSQRVASRFHHVRYTHASGLRNEGAGAQLLCFRRVLMGCPGISLHRNAAYAWHPVRSWTDPLNAASQVADEAAFARFLTARALAEGGVDLDSYVPPVRDTILVVVRGGNRCWENITAVETAAHAVAAVGNFVVSLVRFEGTSDDEIVSLMQRTVMVIAAHGAGLLNILYMQPGSIVLEVTPPSNPETAVFFGALARNIGLRHGTVVGGSLDGRTPGFNDAVHVHLQALRAQADLLLSDFDGRMPT